MNQMTAPQPINPLPANLHLFSGFWTWDVRHDRIYGCENLIDYFGFTVDAASSGLKIADYTDRIDRADRSRVNDAIAKAIADRSSYRETYQVNTKSHGVRRILAQGRCYYDEKGEPSSFPGWFVDVTVSSTQDVAPLLLARHLTELARNAALGGESDLFVYLLEMALTEAQDKISKGGQKRHWWQ